MALGGCLGQKVGDDPEDLVLSAMGVLVSVEQCGQLRRMASLPLCDVRVLGEHRSQSFGRAPWSVMQPGEAVERCCDVPFVPGDEDGFDVGEVLVKGRPPDPSLLRHVGHLHCRDTALGRQCPAGVEDGRAYIAAMLL